MTPNYFITSNNLILELKEISVNIRFISAIRVLISFVVYRDV